MYFVMVKLMVNIKNLIPATSERLYGEICFD